MTDMHTASCLELRLPAALMDEEAFALLSLQLDALGYGEERDVQRNSTQRTAWFTCSEDVQAQREQLRQVLMQRGLPADAIHLVLLDDEWETAWQKNWRAQAIGQRLCVRPSFCDPLPDRDVDIVLEPGMAFGTGTHPTTRLCLEAVERYCLQQPPASMLDMGAGSGLLAIAALKLGANRVLAVDHDADSVAACRENAAHNHVQLQVELADTPPAERFELVVANILAGPLLAMAAPLAACVQQQLILSGLLCAQEQAICTAYEACGLRLSGRATQHEDGDDWLALHFIRE